MNVSGYNTSSTSISVHWDQVPDAYQNGALLYYTVTYRSLPSGFRQTVVVAAPAHQTTLTGLKIYTNYSITVFASTYKGAGNVSAPFFIVTDEDSKFADLSLPHLSIMLRALFWHCSLDLNSVSQRNKTSTFLGHHPCLTTAASPTDANLTLFI